MVLKKALFFMEQHQQQLTEGTCCFIQYFILPFVLILLPDITVNEAHTVQWDDTYDVELYNRGSVSSIDNSTVGIKLTSDIQIEVTRSKNRKGDTYLGIHITHGDGVGDHAKGIIGM